MQTYFWPIGRKTVFVKTPIKPLLCFHYLEDIFGLWDNTEQDFLAFIDILNSYHPKIKLRHNLQTSTVEFLDTCVSFRDSSNQKKTPARMFG